MEFTAYVQVPVELANDPHFGLLTFLWDQSAELAEASGVTLASSGWHREQRLPVRWVPNPGPVHHVLDLTSDRPRSAGLVGAWAMPESEGGRWSVCIEDQAELILYRLDWIAEKRTM